MIVRVMEMRRWPRIEVNAPAKIIVMSGGLRIEEMVDCKVLNISEGGALIAAEGPIKPTEFYLEMSNQKETLHLCSVVRRESMYRVAVKFLRD